MNTAFQMACEEAVEALRKSLVVPKDTGNLAYNAIRFTWEENGTLFHLIVDEAIAPYMAYTNEPWRSPKWNGRKNPNEGWWQKAFEFISNYVAMRLGGDKEQ